MSQITVTRTIISVTFSIAASLCFIVMLEWMQAAFSLAGRPDSCTETHRTLTRLHHCLEKSDLLFGLATVIRCRSLYLVIH